MTDRSTAVRWAALGLRHDRARAGAVLLASLGIAGALAGLGVWLAPHVAGVLGAWIAIVAVVAVAVWGTRRAQRATTPPALGRRAETEAGARAGSVVGLLAPAPAGGVSADLPALADARALPAFVAELELTAHYPAYLARGDEPLVPGRDTIFVPEGTVILTSGAASVPLASAGWRHAGTVARLAVSGARFSGRLAPVASGAGSWRLDVTTADGTPLEGDAPALELRVVPDSAPVVAVPVPGRDTTLPLSLRQPLVIDARDDHGLSRLQVVSWRVSRTGKVGDAVRDSAEVSGVGDRAIVQGDLDAARRGLLPGDTLRFRVEAWDNAPAPPVGRSGEFALRLPSLDQLRAAMRA